jgi:hypothetical protein
MHKHKLSHADETKGGHMSHAHHKKMHDMHMREAKKHAAHLHKMASHAHKMRSSKHHVTAHDRAVDSKNLSHARAAKSHRMK